MLRLLCLPRRRVRLSLCFCLYLPQKKTSVGLAVEAHFALLHTVAVTLPQAFPRSLAAPPFCLFASFVAMLFIVNGSLTLALPDQASELLQPLADFVPSTVSSSSTVPWCLFGMLGHDEDMW